MRVVLSCGDHTHTLPLSHTHTHTHTLTRHTHPSSFCQVPRSQGGASGRLCTAEAATGGIPGDRRGRVAPPVADVQAPELASEEARQWDLDAGVSVDSETWMMPGVSVDVLRVVSSIGEEERTNTNPAGNGCALGSRPNASLSRLPSRTTNASTYIGKL